MGGLVNFFRIRPALSNANCARFLIVSWLGDPVMTACLRTARQSMFVPITMDELKVHEIFVRIAHRDEQRVTVGIVLHAQSVRFDLLALAIGVLVRGLRGRIPDAESPLACFCPLCGKLLRTLARLMLQRLLKFALLLGTRFPAFSFPGPLLPDAPSDKVLKTASSVVGVQMQRISPITLAVRALPRHISAREWPLAPDDQLACDFKSGLAHGVAELTLHVCCV